MIRSLTQLIKASPDGDPEKADLLLRLAELYTRSMRYNQQRADELVALQAANPGSKGKLDAQRKRFLQKAKQALRQSVKIYNSLLANKRLSTIPNADRALFGYARVLQRGKRIQLARTVFKRLIQMHPRSKFIPEAFLSFAEYFFERGQYDHAEKFYRKVLEFPRSRVAEYAMYKMGWTLLSTNKAGDAIEIFAKVLAQTGPERLAPLQADTARALALAYKSVGSAAKATGSFQAIDPALTPAMLESLGRAYLEAGEAASAVAIFRQLHALAPASACKWHGAAAEAALVAKDRALANRERDAMILVAAMPICGQAILALAHRWHRVALESRDPAAIGEALNLYESLASNQGGANRGDVLFHHADLTWFSASLETNPLAAGDRWALTAQRFDAAAAKLSGPRAADARRAATHARHNRAVRLRAR